jgi:hypothetical protein
MPERIVSCNSCKASVVLRWGPPSIPTFNKAASSAWALAECPRGHQIRYAQKRTRAGTVGLAILNGDLMSWDK